MRKNKKMSLITLGLVLCLGLMACSKEESAVSDAVSTEAGIETNEAETEDIAVKVEEASAEIAETTEAAMEDDGLYIPEGIDIESTLPGEEWVASFVGKVAEPVVVIYNDNTGRKEVVQAGSEVTVNPDEDIFAVYFPETSMGATPYSIAIKDMTGDSNYFVYTMDPEKMREIRKRNGKIVVRGGAEDWILEFTIIVK